MAIRCQRILVGCRRIARTCRTSRCGAASITSPRASRACLRPRISAARRGPDPAANLTSLIPKDYVQYPPMSYSRCHGSAVSRAGSADKSRYRGILAGRGGADVDVKDLVVAEQRRVGVGPATMIGKRTGDVEQAACQ
jgi:hypothetical protein